tara:strand:+ start:842 stop:1033 length:192 start_codon:yes stop_codon:yes gene_type:complete
MKVGDLVEVYGYDARGDDPEDNRINGILTGWDYSDEGWIVLADGQIQVYPRIWWKCKVLSESR